MRLGLRREKKVARPDLEKGRDRFHEERIAGARSMRGKLHILQGKLLADVARLPDELRDKAYEKACDLVAGAIDEIEILRVEERWSV